MGWIILAMFSFLVALFSVLAFCKAASDADDESERLWEEYLHKLREIKEDLEDEEKRIKMDEELDNKRMER
jgi:hypothetical protein